MCNQVVGMGRVNSPSMSQVPEIFGACVIILSNILLTSHSFQIRTNIRGRLLRCKPKCVTLIKLFSTRFLPFCHLTRLNYSLTDCDIRKPYRATFKYINIIKFIKVKSLMTEQIALIFIR